MTNQLYIGQTVRNLGIIAKVIGFDETTGNPILRPLWNDGTKWMAKAAKCESIKENPTVLMHKNGLVCFD